MSSLGSGVLVCWRGPKGARARRAALFGEGREPFLVIPAAGYSFGESWWIPVFAQDSLTSGARTVLLASTLPIISAPPVGLTMMLMCMTSRQAGRTMGNKLGREPRPAEVENAEADGLRFALAYAQGQRDTMEDAHTIKTQLSESIPP
jgi:hypothetical protein